MAKPDLRLVDIDDTLECTDRRLRAYVAALVPLRGCQVSEEWHRGRALIEQLAVSSVEPYGPQRVLTLEECAAVLRFMHSSEPLDPATFFAESDTYPSVACGQMAVFEALENAVHAAMAAEVADA